MKCQWRERERERAELGSQIASLDSKIALDSRMTDLLTILHQPPVGYLEALAQLLRAGLLRPQHLTMTRSIVTTEFQHI